MQRLEVGGAVRTLYGLLGVKGLTGNHFSTFRKTVFPYKFLGVLTNRYGVILQER